MNIEVPILVEQCLEPTEEGHVLQVGPLFFDGPTARDRDLGRAVSALADKLRQHLEAASRRGDHRPVADYSFYPEVDLQTIELRLELRGDVFRGWFPLVSYPALGRTLAFCVLPASVYESF